MRLQYISVALPLLIKIRAEQYWGEGKNGKLNGPGMALMGCTAEARTGTMIHGNPSYLGVLLPTLPASVPVDPICTALVTPATRAMLLWPAISFSSPGERKLTVASHLSRPVLSPLFETATVDVQTPLIRTD
jgi:hypothetical protein